MLSMAVSREDQQEIWNRQKGKGGYKCVPIHSRPLNPFARIFTKMWGLQGSLEYSTYFHIYPTPKSFGWHLGAFRQALTSTRYPTRPELLFCYPNPTRTTFKKFRVSGFSQQAVSQQAASNLLTIILKFCCFLVALTRNPLFNWFMMRYTLQAE